MPCWPLSGPVRPIQGRHPPALHLDGVSRGKGISSPDTPRAREARGKEFYLSRETRQGLPRARGEGSIRLADPTSPVLTLHPLGGGRGDVTKLPGHRPRRGGKNRVGKPSRRRPQHRRTRHQRPEKATPAASLWNFSRGDRYQPRGARCWAREGHPPRSGSRLAGGGFRAGRGRLVASGRSVVHQPLPPGVGWPASLVECVSGHGRTRLDTVNCGLEGHDCIVVVSRVSHRCVRRVQRELSVELSIEQV